MIKAKINSEEYGQLSSDMQSHYSEDDGTYVLQVQAVGGFGLDDTAGLKKVLGEVKEERSSLRTTVASYREKLGDNNIEDLLESHSKVDKMKDWTPDDKVNERIASEKKSLQNKLDKAQKKAGDREAFLVSNLTKAHIDAEATAALNKHSGSVKLLLPHLVSKAKLVEDELGFSVKIFGDDGITIPTNKQGQHGDMGFDEYVGDIMKNEETFAPCFSGTDASGANTGTDSNPSHGNSGAVVLSSDQMLDPTQYRAAREAAGKSGRPLRMVGGNPWESPSQ